MLALILMLGILAIPTDQVYAENLRLSVNKSSVKIGEKVTVSITVPGGISATVNLVYSGDLLSFESASEMANANSSTVSMTLGGYGGTNTPTTGTVTFEALTAGTAQFSVTAPVAGNQEGDQVALDGARATVTIQNEANDPPAGSEGNTGGNTGGSTGGNTGGSTGGNAGGSTGGNTGEGSTTTRKSADNSLKVLELSSGTLSPAFKYNTVNYTATVENSVTSVAVNARTSNDKATITSVEGNENLKVGENKIRISVKAENGVVAVYTITVTRKAEAAGPGESENNPPDDPQPVEPTEKSFVKDGQTLYLAAEIPAAAIPTGFTVAVTALGGQNYPCLADTFAGGKMRLLYLTDADGTDARLYLLSDGSDEKLYDFVSLRSENGFVIALPEGEGGAPNSYAMEACVLEEKGSIDVWYAGEDKDFPIFYGVNQSGAGGWYRLDKKELTYMRYVQQEETGKPSSEKPAQTDDSRGEINRLKTQNALIIGIAAIIVIMLLIVIAMLILRRGKSAEKKDEDLEFINILKDN